MTNIITKGLVALATTSALVTGVGLTVDSASAATDHRNCVTRSEYRAIYDGMTQSRMRDLLDGRGSVVTQRWYGYYEGAWVEDGYWDSYYDYYTDEWVDEWVDESYWDDYANYEEMTDSVRSYRTCGGWGTGRVGVNLDNYSYGSGMRVFTKGTRPTRMANYIDALYDDLDYYYGYGYSARRATPDDLTEPKATLPGLDRPAKPESTPTTPAPHAG